MSNKMGSQMHKTAKAELLYNFLKYIFSPITSPMVMFQRQPFWNPIKVRLPSLPEDRVDSGRPNRVSCRLPWQCDKFIFHLNARCSEHWCKGHYTECPSGLASSVKAARWGTSKKWKVCKKTKYIYFLLKGLLYHSLYTKGRASITFSRLNV